MYVIVIAILAVGVWLFARKGSSGSNLYESSPSASPTTAVDGSATPTVSPASEIITTASGLQYQDQVIGTGPLAKAGQTVSVQYTGTLTDGTKFDSSYDRKEAFSFKLGTGQVIKGWDEGVAGMKVGGKRILAIPPALGYGAQANGPIPANSTLIFEVELVAVE